MINLLLLPVILMDFSHVFGFSGIFVFIAIIIIVFFFLLLFQNNFRLKYYVLPILLMIPFVYNNINSLPYIFVLLCAYVFCNTKIKYLVYLSIFFRAIFIIITLYLLASGYISNEMTSGDWKRDAYLNTLGFSKNPNTTSLYFFSLIIFVYVLARLVKNNILRLLIDAFNIFLIIIIYNYTGSRTFFYAEIILYLTGLFVQKDKNIFLSIGLLTPLILFFFSIVITIFLSDNMFFNLALSGRPMFYGRAFDLLTPTKLFFGFDVGDIIIDSSYMKIFFHTGLLGSLFFIYIYKKFAERMLMEKEIWNKYSFFIPVIVAMAFAGFAESILAAVKDITLLFFIIVFSVYKSAKQEIKSN